MNKKKIGGGLGVLAGILAAFFAARQPHHSGPSGPVDPPSVPVYTLTVHVCDGSCANDEKIPGASVTYADDKPVFLTDGSGNVNLPELPAGAYTICVSADRFKKQCQDGFKLPADGELFMAMERDGPPPCGALSLTDRHFHCADGRIWRQRAVTDFPVLEQIQHGREADADRFLDWAQATGLNSIRVLMMIDVTAKLTPDEGVWALPLLLDKLKARGMGAELVALADTKSFPLLDFRGQVQRVCSAARGANLPLTVEVANEPYHATQADAVHDYSNLAKWAQGCGVPVAYGAGEQDYGAEPQGDYVTRHLDRSRDLWNRVRRVKDLGDLVGNIKKLVSDDEAIGADENDIGGRRSGQPKEFFAQGALDRFFELAGTFHCTDCLSGTVPRAVQQESAKAYVAGASIPGDGEVFAFVNDSYGVTAGADWSKVIKVYSFVGPVKSYTVLIGVSGDPAVRYVNGWHAVGVVAERDGIQVVEIQR